MFIVAVAFVRVWLMRFHVTIAFYLAILSQCSYIIITVRFFKSSHLAVICNKYLIDWLIDWSIIRCIKPSKYGALPNTLELCNRLLPDESWWIKRSPSQCQARPLYTAYDIWCPQREYLVLAGLGAACTTNRTRLVAVPDTLAAVHWYQASSSGLTYGM
jgi:hypothetical protein